MSSLAIIRSNQAFEASWCAWIASLERWERNVVLLHEIEWHDKVASGKWEIIDVIRAIEDYLGVSGS
jgi:hypothetical protein